VKSPMNHTDTKRAILIAVALAVVTLLCFSEVVDYGFCNYDDDVYVTANPTVREGVTPEGIGWAFTTGRGSNWHPLTWLSHMADWELFGPDPGSHHAVNLFLHLCSSALLFFFFQRTTGSLWRSAFVAGVFALHPLHVESVAWIAERKDVLSGLFWMLTMLSYLHYVRKPSARRMALVSGGLALGLMAKPMLVTLPFVLLLLDYWPLKRFGSGSAGLERLRSGGLLREKIPLFVLAAVSAVITLLVQHSGGSLRFGASFSVMERLENAVVGYAQYLGKTFWPSDLAVFYPFPRSGYAWWQAPATVLGLAGVSVLVFILRRRYRFLLTGWFWFLGTLVPVIGIVQIGSQAVADRYMYIPIIGPALIAAWGVPALFREVRNARVWPAVAGVAVLALLFAGSRAQLRHWRSSESLFRHALSVTSGNWIASYNLGMACAQENRIDDALQYTEEAVRLKPDEAEFRTGLGQLLTLKGEYGRALAQFTAARSLDPRFPGLAYAHAYCLYRAGRGEEAVPYFEEAVRNDPSDRRARYLLGELLEGEKRYQEAADQFSAALGVDPGFTTASTALERVRRLMGNGAADSGK
jgi:Tfp pilus assembly protein PilF